VSERRSLRGLAASLTHVFVYLAFTVAWMLLMGVGVAVWLIATEGAQAVIDPDALGDVLGPGLLGFSAIAQAVGLAAVAMVLGLVIPDDKSVFASLPGAESGFGDRLKKTLALRSSSLVWLIVAFFAAFTIGAFPSWLAEQLSDLLPSAFSNLDMILSAMTSGSIGGRAVLVLAVCLSAPIFEEVIFRGYLWRAVSHGAPEWVAFAVTTVLFAAYHADPVHVLSLLPTAFFLGYLRWMSGSIWPCILAHFVNNTLATVLTMALMTDSLDESSTPLWIGLVGLGWSTMLCVFATVWTLWRRPKAEE